jgi:hypothetical protein
MTTQTKERPILFSGAMVKAILEGRKTQTRRAIADEWWRCLDPDDNDDRARAVEMCPYGRAGDRLWVRETWQAQNTEMKWWHEWPANDRHSMNWAWTNPVVPAYPGTPPRWLPAIHMPRMACRLTLEIVTVRVERVQDISEDDAIAEGVPPNWAGDLSGWDANEHGYLPPHLLNSEDDSDVHHYTAREAYATYWDHFNAKRGYSWNVNPWVWVIEFKPAGRK